MAEGIQNEYPVVYAAIVDLGDRIKEALAHSEAYEAKKLATALIRLIESVED